MKNLIGVLFIIIITGCKQKPDDSINAAAVQASGAFITEFDHSNLTLRVKGSRSIKKEGSNIFNVKGSVEGFSSFNVPFSVEHFDETVRYVGGDINDRKNWKCLELYVGEKRLK